jgi:hypothetical protein
VSKQSATGIHNAPRGLATEAHGFLFSEFDPKGVAAAPVDSYGDVVMSRLHLVPALLAVSQPTLSSVDDHSVAA